MLQVEQFRQELLIWFKQVRRDLPWRRTSDPYAIWLSEVMLQQTRVASVIPYFERFLSRFPSVQMLANASEADLLSHWAGLGYYYRARNLQKAARAIVASGSFPSSHTAMLALPGVGDYTAAAVASIAFNLPFAVLDGNVFRVLARLYADSTNIASVSGKRKFAEIAARVLDREHPGDFNQAMMELGATVCLPKSPQCLLCPVSTYCRARAEQRTAELPVKILKSRNQRCNRTLYWVERDGNILAWQRPPGSRLMPGFWELPEAEQLPHVVATKKLAEFRHGITIYDYRFEIVAAAAPSELGACVWKSLRELNEIPLSTIFRKAMKLIQNPKPAGNVKAAGA